MICPNCKTDLDGDLIYETYFKRYGDAAKALDAAQLHGATKTTGRWGRQIGHSSMELDRVVSWGCPDCGHTWPRPWGREE